MSSDLEQQPSVKNILLMTRAMVLHHDNVQRSVDCHARPFPEQAQKQHNHLTTCPFRLFGEEKMQNVLEHSWVSLAN
eukprot:1749233-Amphidinium_carterae.1